MRTLSKTKLLAWRQCPKRLWLELHRPELRQESAATQATFAAGHQVGEIARQLYDPAGRGQLIDLQAEGIDAALARSQALLQQARPIFEAGWRAQGAQAFADVLLPLRRGGQRAWRMVEVKSSSQLKPYHRDDAAIQAFVARAAGLNLAAISLALIDTSWVYPGGGQYAGLLVEHDLSAEAFSRADEVQAWVADAQRVAARRKAPAVAMGAQCSKPYECPFTAHCASEAPQPEHPVHWLPMPRAKLAGYAEQREVPDELLNALQRRVKTATLTGKPFFDRPAAAAALAPHKLPASFLDFETTQAAVPRWKGTRPYQQIPFQFSLHRLGRTGKVTHTPFLDLSGDDPSRPFGEALIAACGERGPVFVYNAAFEAGRIQELADRFPRLAAALLAINARVVDLLPVARAHYYHPRQQGSWSIKAVLPALCPDLSYSALAGVQSGGMAMQAYAEATDPATPAPRRAAIEQELLAYCRLDTWAMVRLWSAFTGQRIEE